MPVISQWLCVPFFCRILLLCVLLLQGGCTLPGKGLHPAKTFTPASGEDGLPRVTTFLSLKESPSPAVRIEIGKVDILADGIWLPLIEEPITLDSTAIGSGQVLLGAARLPPSRCRLLRLTFTKVPSGAASGEAVSSQLGSLTVEVSLGGPFELADDDSRSLFITWDVQALLAEPASQQPIFTAAPAFKGVPVDLLYVSCPDAETIFVIRADNNQVVDSFGLPGGPTWMAIDTDRSTQRLYVLAARERMIKVVDLADYRVIDFFPVPLNDVPTFMTVDVERRAAYLLDEKGGYLSRVDLASGQVLARVAIGYRPQYAAYLQPLNLLAVSLGLSQKVLLLDPVTLGTRGSFTTGSRPQGVAVAENRLYVAENGENAVSVFDIGSRTGRDRIDVGFDPARLLHAGSQIYVSHESEGMLTVLVPGQLGAAQEIAGLGLPGEMAYHPFYRRLYVADRERGAVSVLDANANLLLGRISLQALPFGLVTSP